MSTGIATRAPRQRRRHAPLAFALLFALVAPGMALAETAKEKELEARIAQLEQLVQQLVAQQQQVQTQVADVQAKQAQPVAASDKPAATTATIQTTPIQPSANPGTRFSYGGFIKLDAMFTDTTDGEIADSSAGRTFYLPSAIPVGGASEPGTDADFHAQFSRFWFASDTDLDGHKLKGYLEFDLFGGALGNETATNTYGATVRHAYVSWDKWLAGQTWSNFQDVAALPDAVDFIGPTEGTTFVRQAQVRYTHGPWSFSAENPETVLTPYLGNGGRISSDDGAMPDLTARYTMKGDWGHFGVGVLARQLRYATSTGIDSDSTGYGVSVSGKFNLGTSDDIRYMATAGSGIGRYIGLGLSNDGVLDAGNEIENIDLTAGFVAWRHVFSPKLRSNLFYSMAHYDNDKALTGLGITERSQSWHGNLIWSPFPKLDVGAELIWGQRSLEGEADGDLRRLHTHVKYSF